MNSQPAAIRTGQTPPWYSARLPRRTTAPLENHLNRVLGRAGIVVFLAVVHLSAISADENGAPSEGSKDRSEEESVEIKAYPDEAFRATALLFFQALIAGVPEAVAEVSAFPFNLDGLIVDTRSELTRRLREAFRQTDLSRSSFYGVRAFPAEKIIEKYGPPPERMGDIDLDDAWIVVANLGGHGYAAVFREEGGVWRAVAYSE